MLEKVKIPVYNDIVLKTRTIDSQEGYKKTIDENKEYFTIKNEYMKLIQDFRENESDQFIGGMPVQLQKDCLGQLLRGTHYQKLIYGITLKVNGVRHLMYVSKSGMVYFIDRITNFYYFKRPDQSSIQLQPTEFPFLFDGELVFHEQTKRWEFLIFDVLFYEDRGKLYNWMSNNYYDRLFILDKAINKDLYGVFTEFDITLKTWFPIERIKDTNDIYKYVIEETNKERKLLKKPILEEDGLILQPFDGNYVTFREWNVYNNVQFKWKPPSELTVDFKIKFNPENKNQWWLLTKSEQNYDVKQPDGTTVHAIIIPTELQKKLYIEGDVVECKLKEQTNPERNIFIPLNKREDKNEGNSLQTIMSTMEVVQNKFTLDILKPAILAITTGTNSEEVLKFYNVSKLILCSVGMFFTETEISEIKNIYEYNTSFGGLLEDTLKNIKKTKSNKKYKQDRELEFRVYPYIKKGKKENIKKFTYFYFLDFLMKSGMRHEYNFSIDIILNDITKQNETYRSTYKDFTLKNPINIVKRKVKEYRAKPLNDKQLYDNLTFKLSLSTETETDIVIGLKSQLHDRVVYNTIRIKQRNSFYFNNWRIDITKVITTMDIHDLSNETYEIECEYIGEKIPFQMFLESMNTMYKLILQNNSYC
jgi:hypothetical protein